MRDDRGAVLLGVLVIAAVFAMVATGIARRQSYVWKLHKRIEQRETALNAARSGAEALLGRARMRLSLDEPLEGTVGGGSFEARVVLAEIVSTGRAGSGPGVPAAVVRVEFSGHGPRLTILSWKEE